jgi:hypothetical protein
MKRQDFEKLTTVVGQRCSGCDKPIERKSDAVSQIDMAIDEVRISHAKCYFAEKAK